jgi:hypothetical protein
MNLDEIVCGGVGGGVELEDDVGVAKQRQSLWGQRQGCIFYLLQNLLVMVGITNRD